MTVKNKLYGAILGDLMGQPYEFPIMKSFPKNAPLHNPKSTFTDDTLMTLATAWSILDDIDITLAMKRMGRRYIGDYFGSGFKKWINQDENSVGNSWGNGCLMRVSPYFYLPIHKYERNIKIFENCMTSHSNSRSVESLHQLINLYDNPLDQKKTEIVKFNKFQVRSTETIKFVTDVYLNGNTNLSEVLKQTISCGGDTDTNASIIGELHNYKYNSITDEDVKYVDSKLDDNLRDILHRFNKNY